MRQRPSTWRCWTAARSGSWPEPLRSWAQGFGACGTSFLGVFATFCYQEIMVVAEAEHYSTKEMQDRPLRQGARCQGHHRHLAV